MKKGFTLAEVLITLTIIGVIAALTVPNLMRKWEDHAQLSAFKTAYSLLSSAMKEVIYEYGPLNDWNWPNPSGEKDNGEFLGQRIAPYLKVQKYCGKNSGCFSYGYSAPGYQSYQAKNLSGVIGNYTGYGMELEPIDGGRMILANGMRLKIFYRPYWKTLCYFFIDTNGKKRA